MTPATLLVAHGSPDPRSAPVVRRIAAATGTTATFLEFDTPAPMPTLNALARRGRTRATIVPLLLTRAYHGRVDIPRLVERAACETPGLRLDVSAPVGGEHLVPALCRGAGDADALVLAAAGTRDAAALDSIAGIAQRVQRSCGRPCVAAYASAARPGVTEAVTRLRDAGARRVAVLSYFIAPGTLHDRLSGARRVRGVDVRVTEPLESAPELLDAVRFRAHAPAALGAV